MRKIEEPGNAAVAVPAGAAWKAGREAFWDELCPRLQVYLRSFRGLGPEDAEEVLQLALLAFWKRAPELDGDARSWLYRVTRNAAIDALRAGRRRGAETASGAKGALDGTVDPTSPYPGPEDRMLDLEREEFVARFLAGLNDGDRELLHLAYAEGFSYPSIASLTGRPLGTVKWKIASLKRLLAARYRKEFE